ncbi:hypothetical protein P168DRAFT_286044 [Aspergillus campestris IBT 28561]|uniref:Uncharacterized protein n=1 Tax=Aspergillus campestris (strain IBT 28561) TaxID=1392248 RepID=A0A2I1DDD2_ASPC2|nr:uncharacterized protein P168DRAFT_286044 [Aspergillus campestris IBT 28561]PKY07860.1 hypothetical protein P168DRAFT_286044 [Aspergillus campestris IBT 28561]
MTGERPEHLERRRVLVEMEAKVEALQIHELDISQLKELKIDIQPMSLHGTSARKPFFFLPHAKLPEPEDERLSELHGAWDDPEETCFIFPSDHAHQVETVFADYAFHFTITGEADFTPWSVKSVGDYTPYKSVYGFAQPEFGTFHLTDISGGKFPHSKAVIYNDVEAHNQHLLRGELLILLRIMLGQMRKRRFLHHMIAPILLISFMGKRGRVIEGYFDGERLIMGCTDLYNMRDQTAMALKDFAEWYLGQPTGDTA